MPREKNQDCGVGSHGSANVSHGTMFPLETRGSIRNSILDVAARIYGQRLTHRPAPIIGPAPFRPAKTHGTLLVRAPGNALSVRDIHCRAVSRARVCAIERSLEQVL